MKVREIVIKSLLSAFQPLVRFAVRHSLKLQDLTEILKMAFVQVSRDEIELAGNRVSVSKIAVMSGVNRREVTRLQKTGLDADKMKDITSRVLGQWQNNPCYTTKSGKPRVLSAEGPDSEFSELVRSVSADLAPYTVLYEMKRIGVVEQKGNKVRVVSRIYVSQPGNLEEGYCMLGDDINDLILAVEQNINSVNCIPNLHLKTEYDNISEKHIDTIRNWLLEEGSAFHRKVRRYLSQYDRDINPSLCKDGKGLRVSFGSFSLVDNLIKKKNRV